MRDFSSVTDVAWHVDALLAKPENWDRFLSQCQAFIKFHGKEKSRLYPLPFPTECHPMFGKMPEIQFCEEYAVLAALHKAHCEGRRSIDPALWSADALRFPLVKKPGLRRRLKGEYGRWLRWSRLYDEAGKLTDANLPNVLGCLRSVEADLESIRSVNQANEPKHEPGQRIPKTSTVPDAQSTKVQPLAVPAETPRQPFRPVNPVVLGNRFDGPIVSGREKPALRIAQYNVVKALLDAADKGLTKDTLVTKSGHSDALGILHRLADSDEDWQNVIHFAGRSGGRYRIG